MYFILFTVALAIIRTIWNFQVSKLPNKNWKRAFRDRLKGKKRDEESNPMGDAKERFIEEEKPKDEEQTSIIPQSIKNVLNRSSKSNSAESQKQL